MQQALARQSGDEEKSYRSKQTQHIFPLSQPQSCISTHFTQGYLFFPLHSLHPLPLLVLAFHFSFHHITTPPTFPSPSPHPSILICPISLLLYRWFFYPSRYLYNQIVIDRMAYIIEQMSRLRFNYGGRSVNNPECIKSTPRQIINEMRFIKEHFLRGAEKLDHFHVHLQQSDTQLIARYYSQRIYKHIAALFSIIVDLQTQEIRIKSKLMNVWHGFTKVEGRERRKMITKHLCVRGNTNNGDTRVAINVETGEIKIQSPTYYLHSLPLQHTLHSLLQFLNRIYTQNVREVYQQLVPLTFLCEGQLGNPYNDLQIRLSDRKTRQIYRFSQYLNVFLSLASQTSNQEQDLTLNMQRQAESFRRLSENRFPIGQDFSSLIMFSDIDLLEYQHKRKEDNFLAFMQRKYLQDRLQLPLNQKSTIPHENFFVLNYIKVNKKISETMLKKIKVGGFTTIYLSEIEYWYVGSYCVGVLNELQAKDTPPLKKYIIIKREDKKLVQQCGKSRVAHQRFILTKIKYGISMFLPKYYLLAEKDNSYENDLLVDYISHPNLSDYISKNRESLSLNTKIYFVLMIGQALRYLKEYKIAHLDLKPSNIMTHRRLILKLIDFGESYHPQLLKTHQPGFSMPYSAPENYSYSDSYNSKNDVFSLGIIMYELFIGRYPFYFYDERLKDRVYTAGDFQRYWLECAEEFRMYTEPVVCPVIYTIMTRCLDAEPSRRPELEWIVLIFRECLEYFF